MPTLSRPKVEIAVLLSLVAASVTTGPARADDTAAAPRAEAAAPKAPDHARKARRAGQRKAGGTSATPVARSLIGPPSASATRDVALPGSPAAGRDAWTVSPKWSASNSGASAPYGTRALVNELQVNPSETTGYGAGAEVNFHF